MKIPKGMKTRCDQDIFEHGTKVFETKGYEVGVVFMRKWVDKIAKLSGERVDFHKSGASTWTVKTIGDIAKVEKMMEEIKPEYDQYFRRRWVAQRRMQIRNELEKINKELEDLINRKNRVTAHISELEDNKTKLHKEREELTGKRH